MSLAPEETVPCETCGAPTYQHGTKRCHNCWEVETRLAGYLAHGGARARVFVGTAMGNDNLNRRASGGAGGGAYARDDAEVTTVVSSSGKGGVKRDDGAQ